MPVREERDGRRPNPELSGLSDAERERGLMLRPSFALDCHYTHCTLR